MRISIAIPTYEYNGFGKECLEYSFGRMKEQIFEDFEVVISDHSQDDTLRKLCKAWNKKLNIKYIYNPHNLGNGAANMNNAINNCDGEWVKILCQDDYLAYSNSLLLLSKAFVDDTNWVATGYLHTPDRINFRNYHHPIWNPSIHVYNTIGTPSCTAFRNIKPLPQFDTELSYYYDCEYYFRFAKEHGLPKTIDDVTIVNFLWGESVTSKITTELIEREINYVIKKHGMVNE